MHRCPFLDDGGSNNALVNSDINSLTNVESLCLLEPCAAFLTHRDVVLCCEVENLADVGEDGHKRGLNLWSGNGDDGDGVGSNLAVNRGGNDGSTLLECVNSHALTIS